MIQSRSKTSKHSGNPKRGRELEFKGALPFVVQKGQAQSADRWIEKGDRIGDYARDAILSELMAFANAGGGTLVLGLHETKDEPRHAIRLEALPNCEDLVRRLLDACEDIVEPRFPVVHARAFPIDASGAGYGVIRVGKSLSGPHRLKSTREFYIRRGESSVKMDVREIKDATLELARTGDRIERAFDQRQAIVGDVFDRLAQAPSKGGPAPLVIRVSALPMTAQNIANITSRPDVWWVGRGFNMTIDGQNYPCGYPAREFEHRPEIRLRSFESISSREDGGSSRLLRGDGLVEFCLVHPSRGPLTSGRNGNRFYVGWVASLLVGAIAQVDQLCRLLAWDGVEFGLEIEVRSKSPLSLSWDDHGFADWLELKSELPLLLPRYSIVQGSNYDAIVQAVIRDLFNASGGSFKGAATVPWQTLVMR